MLDATERELSRTGLHPAPSRGRGCFADRRVLDRVMTKIKTRAARKAAKVTARHAAHGAVARTRRRPLRSIALLGAGAGVGTTAGWIAGRRPSDGVEPLTA